MNKIIFVLSRQDHFKNCISALVKEPLSQSYKTFTQSDTYIVTENANSNLIFLKTLLTFQRYVPLLLCVNSIMHFYKWPYQDSIYVAACLITFYHFHLLMFLTLLAQIEPSKIIETRGDSKSLNRHRLQNNEGRITWEILLLFECKPKVEILYVRALSFGLVKIVYLEKFGCKCVYLFCWICFNL